MVGMLEHEFSGIIFFNKMLMTGSVSRLITLFTWSMHNLCMNLTLCNPPEHSLSAVSYWGTSFSLDHSHHHTVEFCTGNHSRWCGDGPKLFWSYGAMQSYWGSFTSSTVPVVLPLVVQAGSHSMALEASLPVGDHWISHVNQSALGNPKQLLKNHQWAHELWQNMKHTHRVEKL